MKKTTIIILSIVFSFYQSCAQIYQPKDKDLHAGLLKQCIDEGLNSKSTGDIAIAIGQKLLNTEYVAKTLESKDKEQLIVNLRGLDCVTFLENVVALSRLVKQNKTGFDDYCRELQKIRYRDGKINGYPSRLHYFSDWIYDNQQKGIVKNITLEIGGIPYETDFDIMSRNRDKYPKLSHDDFYHRIINIEARISNRKHYYIPKNMVADVENKIQNGDLICITTDTDGLDITHVGIAIHQNNRLHFMHASSVLKKVVITQKPLAGYLAGIKHNTGIVVARLEE